METNSPIMSDLAIPPGEYLEEVLADLGMTKDELARRMNRPASLLSHIFSGNKRLTEETALQLETVLGVPAHIWTGLEADYRLTLARNAMKEREGELRAESKLATRFCYAELARLGEVPDTLKPLERVRALLQFFGVTSLRLVTESRRYEAAFRCGARGRRTPEALAAWLRLGERHALRVDTAPFDAQRLRAALPSLRALTTTPPKEATPELTRQLAACGVALVPCPVFPHTLAHGATFRLGARAVLMITHRGAWADCFWFSLFHEIGHILLHGSQAVILEGDVVDDREREADEFAREALIPAALYGPFVASGRFSVRPTQEFAARVGVDPGIVVGRLQHDGHVPHDWLNGLRHRVAE